MFNEVDDRQTVTNDFEARARALGVELSADVSALLYRYCAELADYNSRVNLVSNAELPVLLKDHVLDSLTLVPLIEKSNKQQGRNQSSLVDIGSGAGFPGVVLAIHQKNCHVLLLESVAKKCTFLQQVIDTLGLGDRVEVINERAEFVAHHEEFREQFDFATARAVGNLLLVGELGLPFLSAGGWLLAQRSCKQLEQERAGSKEVARRFGGTVKDCWFPDASVTGKQFGVLVIERTAKISSSFPRNGAKLGQE